MKNCFALQYCAQAKNHASLLGKFLQQQQSKKLFEVFFPLICETAFCKRENTKKVRNLQTTKLKQRLNYYEVTKQQISLRHLQSVQRFFVRRSFNLYFFQKQEE